MIAAAVVFTLLLTVLLRSNGKSELEREMASKRYASGLQKAFVIGQGESDVSTAVYPLWSRRTVWLTQQFHSGQVARHPDFHLDPNEMDQAKDAQLLDAMQAEDIAVAAQDTQFVANSVHSEAEFVFKFESNKEEMAALVSFLTSTSSNALPPVDPSIPLDPRKYSGYPHITSVSRRLILFWSTQNSSWSLTTPRSRRPVMTWLNSPRMSLPSSRSSSSVECGILITGIS